MAATEQIIFNQTDAVSLGSRAFEGKHIGGVYTPASIDLENRHRGFILKVKSLARAEGVSFFYMDRLKPIAEESGYTFGENLVGAGVECVVVTSKQTPDIVVAFSYKDMDPLEARKTYDVHRIFSTLFPYNFPHFYACFNGEYARTVRQRIYPANRDEVQVKYPFSRVESEAVFNWGMSLTHFDGARFNYAVAANGGQYYLDTVALTYGVTRQLASEKVKDKIFYFMTDRSYSDYDIAVVQSSIARLAAYEELYRGSRES